MTMGSTHVRTSIILYGVMLGTSLLLAVAYLLLSAGNETSAQTSPPAEPTGLSAQSVAHDSVTLTWDDPGNDSITGYQVLRRSRDGDEYGDGEGAPEFVVSVDDTGSSAATYTDTSVTARTRYVYRVKARNSNGLSNASVYANAETPDVPPDPPPPTGPSRPTGLAVSSASHDSVTSTWDAPEDSTVESYQILRLRDGLECGNGRDAPEFAVIVDDTGSSASSTYTDTSVTAGTRYFYQVKARSPHGLSEASSSADVETPNAPPDTPPPMAPSMPTGLTVASVSHDRVALTWDDPGDSSIERHQILRRSRDGSRYGDGSGAREFVVIVDDIGPSATSYTDSSVSARTRYVYRVQARNGRGLSIVSVYADAETLEVPADPTPADPPPLPGPSRPTGLATSSASLDSVSLTWDDPGDSTVESYQILRCSRDGSRYGDGLGAPELVVIVDHTGSSATTYTDTSVKAWTRYFYRVRARSPHGLSVASSSAGVETPYAPDSRPNVVLILADDLGWGDIQSNNPDSAMTTPNIDSIAAAGTYFTDAHSPASMCTPTRYGLLTGRYAWRSWLTRGTLSFHDRPLIGPNRPTLGTLLQDHGYRTAAIGKWHLGMDFTRLADANEVNNDNWGIDLDAEILDGPLDHGFDEFFGTSTNIGWLPHTYIRDRRFLANPETDDPADPGFYEYEEVLDRVTEEAVAFIEREGQTETPFFLYLPVHAPHKPLAPNDQFDGLTRLGEYADVVAQLDWTVGQVLDALDQLGARENTLVIFTSDNGSYMGDIRVPNHVDHQPNGMWRAAKMKIYEGGHRVPLLMQWPQEIEAGSTVDATVSLTDLYGTLADIVEEEPAPGVAIDSVSLLPLLSGESMTRGEAVVHHSFNGMFAIRDGRWKLVFGKGSGNNSTGIYQPPYVRPGTFSRPWQLYDLEEDPRERNNLVATHPEVVARLEAALDRIRSAESGTLTGDATLKSLRIAGIDIGRFNGDVRSYYATVDGEIKTVRVTAHPRDTDARVAIATPDGRRIYGRSSKGRYPHGQAKIRLSESNTTIAVTVSSPDGSATTTYTVMLTRSDKEPTITGTPQVGGTLTADESTITDPDGLVDATFSYQWIRNGENSENEIVGATGSTYLLMPEDEGKTIKVRVRFTDDAGNDETRISAATPMVEARPNRPATGAPTISGTAQVGKTLTAGTSDIADDDGLDDATFNYQWLADDVSISGETGSTYTLSDAEEGKAIRVRVSFTDDAGNEETLTSEATDAVVAATQPNTPAAGSPTITGTAQVGETLTADTTGISDADGLTGTVFTYQWITNDGTNDSNLQGADAATYAVPTAQVGNTIKVRVNFTDDAGNAESLTSESVYIQPPSPLYGGFDSSTAPAGHNGSDAFTLQIHFSEEPRLSYAAVHDHVLTVTNGDVTAVQRTTPGKNIRWEITLQPDGNDDVTVVLPPTTDCSAQGAVCTAFGKMLSTNSDITVPGPHTTSKQAQVENTPATGQPAITGTADIGNTLGVDLSAVSDSNGLTGASYSYQWLRSNTAIKGATGSTYTVVRADGGHNLKVTVSFTDDNGFNESVTSNTVYIERPPLTAELVRTSGTPTNHDGSSTFSIQLDFSENFGISYVTVRDHALDVTGGTVLNAARVNRTGDERNQRWTITIDPSSNTDIEIALTPTTDCNDDDAICTSDGRMLSSDTTLTIAGPP